MMSMSDARICPAGTVIDTKNRSHFATEGIGLLFSYEFAFPAFGGTTRYTSVSASYESYSTIGERFTFHPQFVLGYLGMPRRYHAYPEEFQVLNVMSSAGASILGVGYLIPMIYLVWSMRYGKPAPPNPWGAKGLEWTIASPPPTFNFDQPVVVDEPAYNYRPSGEVTVG